MHFPAKNHNNFQSISFLCEKGNDYMKIWMQVTHGLSMMLGWTWSNMADSDELEEKLYVAASHPTNPEVKEKNKCSEMYPDPSYPEPSCKIFEWQPREDTMSLDFEHDEL